jgi:hypothetical protein
MGWAVGPESLAVQQPSKSASAQHHNSLDNIRIRDGGSRSVRFQMKNPATVGVADLAVAAYIPRQHIGCQLSFRSVNRSTNQQPVVGDKWLLGFAFSIPSHDLFRIHGLPHSIRYGLTAGRLFSGPPAEIKGLPENITDKKLKK